MRESFIFYKSFYDAISELDDTQQAEIFRAICQYSLMGEESELKGISKVVFTLIKPQLEANNNRYSNGKKGGRPAQPTNNPTDKPVVTDQNTEIQTVGYQEEKPNHNQTETNGFDKEKPNHNQTETKPEANKNVNVNVNDNVNEEGEKKELANFSNLSPSSQKIKSFKNFDKKDFQLSISQNASEAPALEKSDLKDFYDYWSETSASGKMRFQLERTWDTGLRLQTWQRKKLEFKPARAYPTAAPSLNQFY